MINKNPIAIALITDDNYVIPTVVTIKSIIQNKNEDSFYCIYVFGDNLAEESKEKIKSLEIIGSEIHIIDVENKYKEFYNKSLYVSNAAFIRFDVPDFLAQYKKILYLDTDMIVLKDLSDLYNTELYDKYAAVVLDVGDIFYRMAEERNLSHYFNAGMILFNAEKYREEGLSKKLCDLYKNNYENMPLMDQDALNIVFNDNIIKLLPKYNFQQSNSDYWKSEVLKYYNVEPKDLKKDIISIIHYTRMKPWVYKCTYLRNIWDSYYRQCYTSPLNRKYGLFLRLYLVLRGHFKLKRVNSFLRKVCNKK